MEFWNFFQQLWKLMRQRDRALKIALKSGLAHDEDIILPNHDLTVFNISEVSESYLIKHVSQLKSSKAKDIFDCDSVFVKKYANVLGTPITHLVNLSIKQCYFPSAWKSAVITPIFKTVILLM